MDLLAAMRTFVEIVDRGSMTAAAETLDRSQPAIVRSLAALESRLGATLLQRTTRRMSLTPEGRDFLARCRRILADVEEAELAVGPQEGDPSGELRLTAPLEFGRRHVAPLVLGFMRRYAAMRVDLLLHDRNVDLLEEGIDLAVRIGKLADSSMVGIRAGGMRRVVVASPSLLTQCGTPSHPRQLESLPCIRLQTLPGRDTRWTFRDEDRPVDVSVDGAFGSNQIAVAARACTDGVGFGRFLHYQVRDDLTAGRLKLVLRAFEPEPSPVSLVYPGVRLVSLRLRAMLDWLRPPLQQTLADMLRE